MGAAMPLGEQMKYSKEQMMVALTLYNAIGSLNVAILTPGYPSNPIHYCSPYHGKLLISLRLNSNMHTSHPVNRR